MTYHNLRDIGQPYMPHMVVRHLGHKLVIHLRSIGWVEVE